VSSGTLNLTQPTNRLSQLLITFYLVRCFYNSSELSTLVQALVQNTQSITDPGVDR